VSFNICCKQDIDLSVQNVREDLLGIFEENLSKLKFFYKNEKINPITNKKNLEVMDKIQKEINLISDKFDIRFNRQSSESRESC
jgi:hypothetical protein